MRSTLIVFVLTALAAQTTLGRSQSDIAGSLPPLLGGIGNSIINSISNETWKNTELAVKIIENTVANATAIAAEAQQYLEDIAASVREQAIKSIADLSLIIKSSLLNIRTQIAIERSNIRRSILKQALSRLQQVERISDRLEILVITIRDRINENIDARQKQIIKNWNNWIELRLNRVDRQTQHDAKKIKSAEKILNEYINRYSNYLNSCVEEVEVKVTFFEDKVNSTIEANLKILRRVISEVNSALEIDANNSGALQIASGRIKDALNDLSSVPSDLLKLVNEGGKLIGAGLNGSRCVLQTLVEFEKEKLKITKQIIEIIKSDAADESDSSASSESNDNSDKSSESESEETTENESNSEESDSEESDESSTADSGATDKSSSSESTSGTDSTSEESTSIETTTQ